MFSPRVLRNSLISSAPWSRSANSSAFSVRSGMSTTPLGTVAPYLTEREMICTNAQMPKKRFWAFGDLKLLISGRFFTVRVTPALSPEVRSTVFHGILRPFPAHRSEFLQLSPNTIVTPEGDGRRRIWVGLRWMTLRDRVYGLVERRIGEWGPQRFAGRLLGPSLGRRFPMWFGGG